MSPSGSTLRAAERAPRRRRVAPFDEPIPGRAPVAGRAIGARDPNNALVPVVALARLTMQAGLPSSILITQRP